MSMLKSGKAEVMLYRNGDSWEVVGPPHLVFVGAEVEAYHPSGKSTRVVTVAEVVPYGGRYGDGSWVRGQPEGGRRCGATIRGSRCAKKYGHGGWCA